MLQLDKLLVIDLECTCWETESPGNDERQDIIEIGACLFDLPSCEVVDSVGLIVRPLRSTVSPFCERLTTITQSMVDQGLAFAEALDILRTRFASPQRPWASWGNFDRHCLQGQCRDYGLDYPMSSDHFNLKTLYALRHGLAKPIGLYPAVRRAGLVWEGQHHRGVDDARNTARLLPQLLARVPTAASETLA